MTYSVGNIATATDYMAFRGSISPNAAYPSDAAAGNVIAALMGVGFGTRGYGQTATVLPHEQTGNVITASDWNYLHAAISNINIHTGSQLPIEPAVVVGTLIQAQDGSNSRANLSNIITQLDRNRLISNSTQMTTTFSSLSSTRTAAWNTGNTVVHEFTVNFGTQDAARYFFNTGGAIYVSATFTGTSDPFSNDISSMLSQMGVIQIGSQATVQTGTGGTAAPIGYYGLTTSYQQIFTHPGSSPYTSLSYTIMAKCDFYTPGVNGGNGAQVHVTAAFGLGGYSNTASGTLTSTVGNHQASGVFTITTPTYTTINGVNQG